MSKVRPLQQKRGWAWVVIVAILKPLLLTFTKRKRLHGERVPASGGCIIAMNHISHIDPLTLGHFLYDYGRLVRYLTKDALFRTPVLKYIVKGAGQIPVARLTKDAKGAYDAAVIAIGEGECIGIYPEGTITRDPDGWPMRGKTGAARIALATGCPVIPIGQWGAQEILPAYSTRPHLFPRKTVAYNVGEPVDLSDLMGKEPTAAVLQEATERDHGRHHGAGRRGARPRGPG